jgi:hypothetical protein
MTINNSIENGPDAGHVAEQAASMGRRTPALSDTAIVLLSAAANRGDGSILPPPADLKARGGALKAVLNHLVARSLVEEMPVASDAESWRREGDEGRIGLRITAAGYAAIGVEEVGDGPAAPGLSRLAGEVASRVAADANGSGLDGAGRPCVETEVVDDDPLDGTITWTDGNVYPVTSESDGQVDRVSTSLSSQRRPSKQDQIIALLSRAEGATIDDLMSATGWLPHTVRAVLSGLRKKGHRIDRQKEGEADSVYRILPSATAEAAAPATGEAVWGRWP